MFVPENWSLIALVARELKLVFAGLVDRRYEKELKSGDTIHVPSVGNLSIQTKSQNTAITFETVTETNVDISIATFQYNAIGLEHVAAIQANRDQAALYAPKQGYALALGVDDLLAGLPDDFGNNVGTLAVASSYDDLVRAIQYLDDAEAPQEDRAWVISPAQKAGWLKLVEYTSNDYAMLHGSEAPMTGLERAYLRSFLNIPAYVSANVEGTNAAGHDNTLFQREAICLVMQEKPRTVRQYDIHYDVDIVLMTQMYGYKEMRDDHGVWVKGA